VKELHSGNFGLLIAYVLPGITAVWGLSYVSETVEGWLAKAPESAPTVGGVLYVTLAAIGAGLVASTVRWLIIDTVHHWTGISRPRCQFSGFEQKTGAYDMLGEVHYRYYQFYGNGLVALTFAFLIRRGSLGFLSSPVGWVDASYVALACILAAGSRDTFRKYNQRLEEVLGTEVATVVKENASTASQGEERSLEPGVLEE
jgi:hypothetical protein